MPSLDRMRRATRCICVFLALAGAVWFPGLAGTKKEAIWFVPVSSPDQARQVSALADSLRTFGGRWNDIPLVAGLINLGDGSKEFLASKGIESFPIPSPPEGLRFPFLQKVLACAEAERQLQPRTRTLIYSDPQFLVLRPPQDLILQPGKGVALRPVHLANTVGIEAGKPLDAYWEKLFTAAGGRPKAIPVVRSFVDNLDLHAYYTCTLFSIDPSRGLLQRWRDLFLKVLEDRPFLEGLDQLHLFFLHQAVLSVLITRDIPPGETQELPPQVGYPLGPLIQLAAPHKPLSLENVVCAYVDTLWATHPSWIEEVTASEPVREWLRETSRSLHRVAPNLYREESACNTYLVQTPAGQVVIDPGGSDMQGSVLRSMAADVRAVFLTHTHNDHIKGSRHWVKPGVPLIAQEGWRDFKAYHERLAGFFARRGAAQGNVPERDPQDPDPDTSFTDHYQIEIGGWTFEAWHAPGETPDQALIWVPKLKAVFIGDNYFFSFPNLYALRGSPPRWPLDFIASLDRALAFEPELLLPGHGEPVIGKDRIRQTLTQYRDAIRFVHDATVKGMNEGQDVYTLMRTIQLPAGLTLPESYGKVSWSVRGLYEAYGGWFDENPSHLFSEPPTAISADLMALAGGPDRVIEKVFQLIKEGKSVKALLMTDHLVTAYPGSRPAWEARLAVLRHLRQTSRNYLEAKWLDAAIAAVGHQIENVSGSGGDGEKE